MKCTLIEFAKKLDKGLPPVTLISGNEPLLLQDAIHQIRETADLNGYTEHLHKVLLNDQDLEAALVETTTGSLFASKRLCEFHCHFERTTTRIDGMLLKLAEAGDTTSPVVIATKKIDKASHRKRWIEQVNRHGLWVEIWPLNAQQHRQWLERALASPSHPLSITPEALHTLAELTFGNLLIAAQEVQKLALLHPVNSQLSREDVLASTADSARFTLYEIIDNALEGNVERVTHGWQQLRLIGVKPIELMGIINRALQDLLQLSLAISEQQDQREVVRRLKIFPAKMQVYNNALKRLRYAHIIRCYRHAAALDALIKGMRQGNADHAIQALLLTICGKRDPALLQLTLQPAA